MDIDVTALIIGRFLVGIAIIWVDYKNNTHIPSGIHTEEVP